MTSVQAFIATTRFGLGPGPGELAAAAGDPRGWLLAQLDGPPPVLEAPPDVPATVAATAEYIQERRGTDEMTRQELRREAQEIWRRETAQRTRCQITSDRPFMERLVTFWSNHFTVSMVQRPNITALAGAFEREAIRPNILGRFDTMLQATARHQAMLFYLDNVQSMGPDSAWGKQQRKNINENYAREMLELQTLGVNGGYSQADVIALARILTGWSVAPKAREDAGGFAFLNGVHQPGDKRLLAIDYPQDGMAEGQRALTAIALHPATARHVATKLARHFVADDPPPALIQRLTRRYLETSGDLLEVTRALVQSPEPFAAPLQKFRTPNDLVVATCRAVAPGLPDQRLHQSLAQLGQPAWGAPSPKGWPDRAQDWLAPDALLQRIEWAGTVARALPPECEPAAVFEATIAPVASAAGRRAILGAGSRAEALTLLLASPEFQRR